VSDYYYLGAAGDEERLSNVDRDPVTEKPLVIRKDTRLSSGKLVWDRVAVKRVFVFRFLRLPGQDGDVIDGAMGRDRLRSLFDGGGVYNLQVPLEEGGYDVVEVRFRSYDEVRALVRPFFQWDVKVTLEEV